MGHAINHICMSFFTKRVELPRARNMLIIGQKLWLVPAQEKLQQLWLRSYPRKQRGSKKLTSKGSRKKIKNSSLNGRAVKAVKA